MKSSPQKAEPGHLYLVATPLGNLGDLSPRAISILSSVDIIACEDTRVTKKLLTCMGLDAPQLVSYRDENEIRQSPLLIEQLQSQKAIALVSDAGTPTVSDPGFRIVRECHKNNIPVVPIPGPAACITALCASGLPSNQFFFAGFLPPKSAARIRFFESHKESQTTVILYESCHRIEKFLNESLEVLGENRVLCIAREITKLHETIITAPLGQLHSQALSRSLKGEFVILIAPADFSL